MKVGIVGCGMVGATAAYALVMRGVGREIVLVDKNPERSAAEAADLEHAVPFANPLRVRSGAYSDLAGANVVVIAAGVNQRPGETRLQLLERNASVFREVVPAVVEHAPNAVIVVATNPVDVMTHLTAHLATRLGVPAERILGSGTTLDTARFRVLLGQRLGIDPQHVHAYVVGEHGDSEVLPWSTVSVGGMRLDEYCAYRQIELSAADRAQIDEGVRRAAYTIINGKGATYYGIGSALARIVDVILHDQRSILSVCAHVPLMGDVEDVTLALPHIVGGCGIVAPIHMQLSDAERTALHKSASILRGAIDSLNLAAMP